MLHTFSDINTDDTSLQADERPEELHTCRYRLGNWSLRRRLQLNRYLLPFESQTSINRFNQEDVNLHIESAVIKRSDSVRELGVKLDYEPTMTKHISDNVVVYLSSTTTATN